VKAGDFPELPQNQIFIINRLKPDAGEKSGIFFKLPPFSPNVPQAGLHK